MVVGLVGTDSVPRQERLARSALDVALGDLGELAEVGPASFYGLAVLVGRAKKGEPRNLIRRAVCDGLRF